MTQSPTSPSTPPRFIRLGDPGRERPAILDDSGVYELSGLTADIDGEFLATDGLTRAKQALAAGELPELDDPGDGSGLRLGSPIARPPAVVCVGMNYAAHAAEGGSEPPTEPVIFFKHPNTVVGPFDDVIVPPGSDKVDWEVELGIVIGKPAGYLASDEDALACVAGYTIANDVSERTWQLEISGGQWSKGKCAPTFNPLGPWLVAAGDVPDVQQLQLRSTINGQKRQDSNTADMIFDVATIVRDLSRFMTFSPGDLINTGTPEGVALSGNFSYVQPGDVYEASIEGLGTQRQTFVAAG